MSTKQPKERDSRAAYRKNLRRLTTISDLTGIPVDQLDNEIVNQLYDSLGTTYKDLAIKKAMVNAVTKRNTNPKQLLEVFDKVTDYVKSQETTLDAYMAYLISNSDWD